MKTGLKGKQLIKRFESLQLEAYKCPAGVLTIGYGHTGADVHSGMKITEMQVDVMLEKDLVHAENAVNAEKLNINQNQFDALVSFAYNVGVSAFKSSTLLKMIRVNPVSANIQFEFHRWNKSRGQVLVGLTRRRKAEVELYFSK